MRTFLIAALPRSRTGWLSTFFNQGRILCEHELLADVRPDVFKDHVLQLNAPVSGSAETAAILYPSVIYHVDAVVVIDRPISDIQRSLTRINVHLTRGELNFLRDRLDFVAKETGALRIKFDEIDGRLELIHKRIAPTEVFDSRRAKFLSKMNVQITGERWQHLFDAAKRNHVLA